MKGIKTSITTCTVIYDMNGTEIGRMEGNATVNPKDYDAQMPITYKQYRTTTELLAVVHIEKEGAK